jgi:hypothetical protein
MNSLHVTADLLNTEGEREKKSGAAQSKQAEIKHGGKLERARESEW